MRLKVSNVCQLLDKSKYPATQTKQGVTYTNDGNGIITLNGTNTASYLCVFVLNEMDGKPGHKYMQLGATDDGFWNRYGLELKWVDSDGVGHGFIMTNGIMSIPSDAIVRNIYVSALVYQGYTVSNKTFKPQLFDLTAMYGAGNEPTTVAQFRQDFPNEMYEYSPVCWKKFRRLKYVTETKNLCDFARILTLPLDTQFETTGFYQVEINVEPNTQYTLSRENNNVVNLGGATYLGMDNVSRGNHPAGFWLNHELLPSYCKQQITIESNADGKLWIFFAYGIYIAYKNGQNPFGYLQLELGSTATPYQPYGYLPLNRGKFIANKEPVQLLDKSKYPVTSTSNGITYTKNEDGSYDVNGTVIKNGLSTCLIGTAELKKNHIYLNNSIPGTVANSQKSYVECKMYYRSEGKWIFPASRFKCGLDDAYAQITLLVNQTAGTVISNEKLYPELFDLTEMYGAGNEPTAEEFWATHPKTTMYDYNPYNAITFR